MIFEKYNNRRRNRTWKWITEIIEEVKEFWIQGE